MAWLGSEERQGKEVTTMTNLERIRKALSIARRKKIKARAAQLIGEEMTLQELRRARSRMAFPNSKSEPI